MVSEQTEFFQVLTGLLLLTKHTLKLRLQKKTWFNQAKKQTNKTMVLKEQITSVWKKPTRQLIRLFFKKRTSFENAVLSISISLGNIEATIKHFLFFFFFFAFANRKKYKQNWLVLAEEKKKTNNKRILKTLLQKNL